MCDNFIERMLDLDIDLAAARAGNSKLAQIIFDA